MSSDDDDPSPNGGTTSSDDDGVAPFSELVVIYDLPYVAWTTPTRLTVGDPPIATASVVVADLGDPVATIGREREQSRARFTDHLILGYFALNAVLLLFIGLHRVSVDESLQLASTFVSPVIALLGACFGYYFARKAGSA